MTAGRSARIVYSRSFSEMFAAGRQSAPKVYAMNASIYVWHRHTLERGLWGGVTRLHVMPRARSIDIDSELDFRLVEILMRDRVQQR